MVAEAVLFLARIFKDMVGSKANGEPGCTRTTRRKGPLSGSQEAWHGGRTYRGPGAWGEESPKKYKTYLPATASNATLNDRIHKMNLLEGLSDH